MGRSASHVSLEVALKCKPALTFISEEVAEKRQSLPQLIDELARIVLRRGLKGINHGVVVIPEGLIEHIPECQELIDCLNQNAPDPNQPLSDVQKTLPGHLHALWNQIPESFQSLLSFTRDSHGNLPVSQLDTERLLADMAADRIRQLSNQRTELETLLGQPLSDEEFANAQNYKFQAQSHFFGYEGRCGLPSTFDADYSYNLGIVAAALALEKRSGYMASVSELSNGGTGYGIPLLPLLHMENRFGVDTAVIEKFTVKLDSPAFQYFVERRETWAEEDHFASPGPRQYQGPCAQDIPFTVALNQGYTSYQYQFS